MGIDSIESSVALDHLDIQARLEELRLLKQGWLDGEGEAFDPAGMDWLEASVREHYSTGLPSPRIYPSPGGQILFEWKIDSRAASLEIDPENRTGYWHVLDTETKQDSDEDIDLATADGWGTLARRLAGIREGEASD